MFFKAVATRRRFIVVYWPEYVNVIRLVLQIFDVEIHRVHKVV